MLEHPKKSLRFYEIDLLRFIAAVSVVFYHYTFQGHAVGHDVNPYKFNRLGELTRYGYLGVHLFFIISGFVILLSSEGKTVREFFVSRVTRLYPAFWVACTLTVGVEFFLGADRFPGISSMLKASGLNYLVNMTMLHEFFGIQHVDGAYWSLTVEITFYFLIAVLIGFRLLKHLDLFITLLLGYAVVDLVMPHPGSAFSLLFFPKFAPLFCAGMLFYSMRQGRGRTTFRWMLLAVSYVLAVSSGIAQTRELAEYYHCYFSPFVITGLITSFFGVFALIVFAGWKLSKSKWLLWAGALTYPVYLLHSNIGYIIFHHAGPYLNKYVLLAGTILFIGTLAFAIHVLFEKKFAKLIGVQLNRFLTYLDEKPTKGLVVTKFHKVSLERDKECQFRQEQVD